MGARYLKCTLAYDGTDFCGWQVQATGRSVQAVVERAWQRVTQESIRVVASGRTDAGVHARGQVISLQTSSELDNSRLHRALNANLPDDVRMLRVDHAPDGFHAIRDARRKRYRYVIQDGELPDLFQRRYCWHLPRRLDIGAMRAGSHGLVGQHDFRAFQSAGSPRKSTVRRVDVLEVERFAGRWAERIEITVEADGFLYNMVRNLVGALVEVGQGRRGSEWPTAALASGDRRQAGATAPARGLCLESVTY